MTDKNLATKPYPQIELPYLLVCPDPSYQQADGKHYLHRLWARDLQEHFPYLRQLTLASPKQVNTGIPASDLKAIANMDTHGANLDLVDLPKTETFAQVLRALPKTVKTLWKAIKRSEVVHVDIFHGWPIPYGWLAVPMAKLQRKFVVTVVETDILQGSDSGPMTPKRWLRIKFSDWMARWCAKRCDLAFISLEACRPKFFSKNPESCHVFPPSWINKKDLVPEAEAKSRWEKLAEQPLRLVFAARLVETKGVRVLIEAMQVLEKRGVAVELDVYGLGELEAEIQEAEKHLQGRVKLHYKGTVAYGPKFFQMLHQYHAVLIPSISNEQPRLVFDSFSQALPVIASDTLGLREQIVHETSGLLFQPGEAEALADSIFRIDRDRELLKTMAIQALKSKQEQTIGALHRRRAALLEEALKQKGFLS